MKPLQNTYKDTIPNSKEKRKYDKKHEGYKKSSGKWNPVKIKLSDKPTWDDLMNYDRLSA